MSKTKLILSLVLLAIGYAPMSQVQAASPQHVDSVNGLWLDFRLLNEPLVETFNRVAGPNDIARIEHVEDIPLLEKVTTGRKLLVFRSIAETERIVPLVAQEIDIIGYNLEDRPASPTNERNDPVDSAKHMRALADQYGLMLAFGPDHDFALSHGVEIAPFVDIFVLQIQLAQTEPAKALGFVLPLVPKLHAVNPDLNISVQVRTEGDVEAVVDLIDSIRDLNNDLALDGVSILTSRETVPIAEALVNELRTRKSAISDAVPQLSKLSEETVAPTTLPATDSSLSAADISEKLTSSTPPPQSGTLTMTQFIDSPWLLMIMVGALVAGAIGGGLVVALIYSFRRRNS